MALDVRLNLEKSRFEVEIDGQLAMVEFMLAGNNMIFTHTEVPETLEGQGIATQMADVALKYAKDEGHKVQALCPFIASYVPEHPEYHSITWGYSN